MPGDFPGLKSRPGADDERLRWVVHAREQSAARRFASEEVRAELSVGFIVGLASIARLFAGVAPVVRLRAGLVVTPGGLVEDGKTLKGLAGQGL